MFSLHPGRDIHDHLLVCHSHSLVRSRCHAARIFGWDYLLSEARLQGFRQIRGNVFGVSVNELVS